MRNSIVTTLSALALSAFALPAAAQTDLTCADIDFNAEVRANYPDVDKACLDVVEINGERFAKVSAEIIRTRGNTATFKFKHNDGTFGPVQTTTLAPEWRANIGGREYRIRELTRGQELNVYLPSDRWEADLASPETAYVAYTGYTMMDDTEEETTMAALPSTASPLFAIGGAGGLALLLASALGIYRRRTS